jgi:hypothetical protein
LDLQPAVQQCFLDRDHDLGSADEEIE